MAFIKWRVEIGSQLVVKYHLPQKKQIGKPLVCSGLVRLSLSVGFEKFKGPLKI
jgi:hypothetical protein